MSLSHLSLTELRDAAELAATIAAAAEAGILRALAAGPASVRELARSGGLDERATRIMVQALEDGGWARRSDDGWVLGERGRQELGDDAAVGGLPLWLSNLRSWTRLAEVLRSGAPIEEAGTETDEEALARYMAGMAAAPAERVERLVGLCLERFPGARRVLDLGGGPGHMARAFAERGVRTTLLDTRETIAYVEDAYDLAGVDGLELVGGDFMDDTLPAGPFDLVLMSNITHIYSPEGNRDLLTKVAGVLGPGGGVAIADFVRGRSPRAARFALVMLLRTGSGDTYSEREYAAWLDLAGFEAVVIQDLDAERQLITARKKDRPAPA
jgi:SAM-dependent methyltransferase